VSLDPIQNFSRQLAQRVQEPIQDPVKPLNRRVAKVIGVNSGNPPSVNIHLNGSDIPSVRILKGYIPTVGDTAVVEFSGTDPLVIGALADTLDLDLCWDFGALPGYLCLDDVAGVTSIRGFSSKVTLTVPNGGALTLDTTQSLLGYVSSGAFQATASTIRLYWGSATQAVIEVKSDRALMTYGGENGARFIAQSGFVQMDTGGGGSGSVRVIPSLIRAGWTSGTAINIFTDRQDFYVNNVHRAYIDSTSSVLQSGSGLVRATTTDALLWFDNSYFQAVQSNLRLVAGGVETATCNSSSWVFRVSMNIDAQTNFLGHRVLLNGTALEIGYIAGFGVAYGNFNGLSSQPGVVMVSQTFDTQVRIDGSFSQYTRFRNYTSSGDTDIGYRTAYPSSDSSLKTAIATIDSSRLLRGIKMNPAKHFTFIDDPLSIPQIGIMADALTLPTELRRILTSPSSSVIGLLPDGTSSMTDGPMTDVAYLNFNAQVGWLWESMRHLISLLEAENIITVPAS